LVLGVGLTITIGLCFAPAELWSRLFGSDFSIAGKYNLPYLLALYALATVIYSLAGVIITFEMSYKIANTSWVQLLFSGILIAAICAYHSSLREVVLVQLALMCLLLVFVAIPFLINSLTDPKEVLQQGTSRPLRLICRVSEDVAIAEFLKSDFNGPAFREYHRSLGNIVKSPNFDIPEENAKRRALLFLRHGYLWRELPADTEWYEAEIATEDLANIRMFPRAQWRKIANGRFSTLAVSEGIKKRQDQLDSQFVSKIHAISRRFDADDPELAAVLMIGVSEADPVTVIDGNHRLMGAMMNSPQALRKLRFICGLSPRMTECCWYRTNLMTLFRYAKNVLTHSTRNPAAELARLL
jgi:hypothetical protein